MLTLTEVDLFWETEELTDVDLLTLVPDDVPSVIVLLFPEVVESPSLVPDVTLVPLFWEL